MNCSDHFLGLRNAVLPARVGLGKSATVMPSEIVIKPTYTFSQTDVRGATEPAQSEELAAAPAHSRLWLR